MAEQQKIATVAEAEAVDLGEFGELLEKDFRVKKDDSEKLQQLVRNLALAAQSRSETTTISSNAIKSIKSLIAGIDKMLTEQINEILHAPEVREMEGTWRGLWYLVNNTETDQKLKIRVMNISKEQLADTLEDYEGQMWDQSPIFNKVYTDEYSMLGGEPFGVWSAATSSRTIRATWACCATCPAFAPRRIRRSSPPPRPACSAWTAGRNCPTRRTCSRSSPTRPMRPGSRCARARTRATSASPCRGCWRGCPMARRPCR